MEHLETFLKQLQDPAHLAKAGFKAVGVGAADVDDEGLLEENECASIGGHCALSSLRHRAVRNLWMFSWPTRLIKILGGGAGAVEACQDFQTDQGIFKELSEIAAPLPEMLKIRQRHVFNMVRNMQFNAGFEEVGYAPHADIRSVVERHTEVICTSLPVEEINGTQKVPNASRQGRQFKRPERRMGIALEKKILSERNDYIDVAPAGVTAHGSPALPRDAFEEVAENRSMDFGDITSSGSPDWHSPQAHHWTAKDSDIFLLRSAKASPEGFNAVERCWIGELADSKHQLLVGRVGPSGHTTWYVALHKFPHGGVLCWPVELNVVGKNKEIVVLPKYGIDKPEVFGIFSLKRERHLAAGFAWRSWPWQVRALPEAASWTPGLRMFADSSGVRSLAEVASENARWQLDRALLVKFAVELGPKVVILQPGASLFEVAFSLVKGVLKTSDEATMHICFKRLARMLDNAPINELFLEIDRAAEVCEKTDIDAIRNDQKDVTAEKARALSYKAEYAERARKIFPAPKAKAKAVAKATPKPSAPAHCDQKAAKQWILADASIWLASAGAWHGHCPPFSRVRSTFEEHGSSAATLKNTLQLLWLQSLSKRGLDRDACPYSGIFE